MTQKDLIISQINCFEDNNQPNTKRVVDGNLLEQQLSIIGPLEQGTNTWQQLLNNIGGGPNPYLIVNVSPNPNPSTDPSPIPTANPIPVGSY